MYILRERFLGKNGIGHYTWGVHQLLCNLVTLADAFSLLVVSLHNPCYDNAMGSAEKQLIEYSFVCRKKPNKFLCTVTYLTVLKTGQFLCYNKEGHLPKPSLQLGAGVLEPD